MNRTRPAIFAGIAMLMLAILPVLSDAGTLPRLLGYQGKLTNSGGQALSGTYTFKFEIFNDVNNSIWDETQYNVTVNNGLYTVYLGTVEPLNLLFDGEYWLEITVGSDKLTPRQPLVSSPYTFRSEYANNAATATYAVNATSATYVLNPGIIDKADNLAGGSKYAIPYQDSQNNTEFLDPGTDGQVLVTHGGAATPPGWLNQSALKVGSITNVIGSTQIAAGRLPVAVVVSSLNSQGYFNDIKVSSAIYADYAANAGSIRGVITSTQIAAGRLPVAVVVSSLNSQGYFNDIKVSSAIYADYADSLPAKHRRRIVVWRKPAADSAAADITADQFIFTAADAITITGAKIEPEGTLNTHNSNNATLTLSRWNSDGSVPVEIVSLTTDNSSVNWAALSTVSFGALGNNSLSGGQKVSIAISKNGTGVVVPICSIQIEYTVD